MTPREDEQGMILVNVLMIVAIAAGLVLLMINREELGLDRALRLREASRAMAVARGGELSALVALRRDAETAPDADYRAEAWGKVAENGVPIAGGTFDLAIADAEGRFNLNMLRSGEAGAVIRFTDIGHQVGLSDDQIVKLTQLVRLTGPVTDLRPLRFVGVDPRIAAQLERLVTALPGDTSINLNAADQEMLAVLFHDPLVAERLVKARERQGFLTPKDLTDNQLEQPVGTSFKSSTFWVRTRATIGMTSQQLATLVQRRGKGEEAEAVPVARWRNAAVPPGAPAFGS